jgi:hypothetical protein
MEGRPIAVLFALQLAAVIVFRAGGIVGHNVLTGADLAWWQPPRLTEVCQNLGLWPLMVPCVWVALAFFRASRDASYGEMLLWCAFAVGFFVIMSAWGLLAAMLPLFCW